MSTLENKPAADRSAPWLLAAAMLALALAVVFATASVRAGDDPGPGAIHGDVGSLATGSGPHAAMMTLDEGEYLVEMIAHHREAIDAAGELERSARPEMRDLGGSVITSQTDQVTDMRSWLDRWHEDARTSTYVPMMRDLSGLAGDDLDRTFLEDMVMHHRMAVMMSRHLLSGAVDLHPDVSDLAQDIVVEQTREIRQMSRWLAAWFGVRAGMRMSW